VEKDQCKVEEIIIRMAGHWLRHKVAENCRHPNYSGKLLQQFTLVNLSKEKSV